MSNNHQHGKTPGEIDDNQCCARSRTNGEDYEWGGTVPTSVTYEIATIEPNIYVDGESHEEVKKMVVRFIQDVPFCKEEGPRWDHPGDEDMAGPFCVLQLGDHSRFFRSRVSGNIVARS